MVLASRVRGTLGIVGQLHCSLRQAHAARCTYPIGNAPQFYIYFLAVTLMI